MPTTYGDSPYWFGSSKAGSPGIFLRDPVIDGVTPLTEAMALLDAMRKEAQAIEHVLGTDVAGSATNLATRLSKRMSESGVPKGRCYPLRAINTDPSTPSAVAGWYNGNIMAYQFGKTGAFTSSPQTITYPNGYFSGFGPNAIIAQYTARSTTSNVGWCIVDGDTIDHTDFDVYATQFHNGNTVGFNTGGMATYNITWVAIGGIPT